MKRIVYALFATLSGLVLVFSYRTSVPPEPAVAAPIGATRADAPRTDAPRTATSQAVPAPASTGSAASSASPSPDPRTAASGTAARTGLADGTFTGAAANTRYGDVQVQITVSGGVIADVQMPRYPSANGRDRQINESALPRLISETLSAQSAQIDMVSGATYTSTGYLDSLQSALDQAAA